MKKIFIFIGIILSLLTACAKSDVLKPFSLDLNSDTFSFVETSEENIGMPFAKDLVVVPLESNDSSESISSTAASIFRLDDSEVFFAKNVHEKLYPASLTKVMTGLIALKYGNLEDVVTITEESIITESGAKTCGFKVGDKLTLEELLNASLVYSGNDAAMAIAIHMAGSQEEFARMMNDEAKLLGATNTNFVNPHGLSDDAHYSTAYDLYLIFNESIKFEEFIAIVNKESYQLQYTDALGVLKENTFATTNQYFTTKENPEGFTVLGGKTGTTNAAGSCLILLSKDSLETSYVSIILKADGSDLLYTEMSSLFGLINK